jgi:hypothetical protein
MNHLARLQLDEKESKERTEEEVRDLEEIAGPHLCSMIAQESPPGLSTGSFWANLLHILLDGPFTHPNIQLEELTSNALRSPEPVVRCHLPNQSDGLVREPRLARAGFRRVLPKHTEELTMEAEKRLRLDDKERLFPGPNHSSEKYQKHSICFPVHWSFDLSTQNDQLVSQQRVFRQQFGFASGQISTRSGYKGSRQWFDPTPNTFLEPIQAKTDALLDRGKYAQHEWNLLFVKIGAWSEHMYRMDRVDCTRI